MCHNKIVEEIIKKIYKASIFDTFLNIKSIAVNVVKVNQ